MTRDLLLEAASRRREAHLAHLIEQHKLGQVPDLIRATDAAFALYHKSIAEALAATPEELADKLWVARRTQPFITAEEARLQREELNLAVSGKTPAVSVVSGEDSVCIGPPPV